MQRVVTGVITTLLLLIFVNGALATLPQTINYQGYLKNTDGTPVNAAVSVVFSIYGAASGGTALWSESRSVTPANGVYSVQLGSRTAFPVNLFANGTLWLGVKVGSDAEMLPRQQLTSDPYSFRAAIADSVAAGGVVTSSLAAGAVTTTQIANNAVTTAKIADGSVTPVKFSGVLPVASGGTGGGTASAALANLGGVNRAGDTMTGSLTVPTLSINNGNLNLPATTATVGIIYSGGYTLMHTFGNFNFFAGEGAGNLTMTGGGNTASGYGALQNNTTGLSNTATGVMALSSNTTGFANTANGLQALLGNTTANGNTAIGDQALFTQSYNGGGSTPWFSDNTAVGGGALYSNQPTSTQNGRYNTAIGFQAMHSNTTGCNNTALGFYAGDTDMPGNANTSGHNNTFIGYESGPGTSTQLTNATAIGANALVSASDSLVLGATGVKVGIGTTTPTEALDVVGNVRVNDKDIYLKGNNDIGQGLGWYSSSAKPFIKTDTLPANFDGPVLYGYGAGALGTALDKSLGNNGMIALVWDLNGNVYITGNLTKGGGSFKIDHPLDPRNKYLYHSFVESPDMMNIYNGNVILDKEGRAVVELPEWFEALNRDFRYQLTCIGGFAPMYVEKEVADNSFTIAGGKEGMKVSWQVTGIRKDAYADKHRIAVEEEKPAGEKGTCLHAEACAGE
jgi:hypothetical protein